MRQKANPKCQRSPADVEAVGIHVWKLQKRYKANVLTSLLFLTSYMMSIIVEHSQNSDNISKVLGLLQYHFGEVAKCQHAL